ncbi:MAG: hypothetical protein IT260_08330 [Saprospiraceae bacterium]|nr:hypothetical protein [Saprospiraceae bacterium]
MKVKHLFQLFFAGLLLLAIGCSKEDPGTAGHYSEGVFVVNEGTFGGTGTITWHNPATGETVQDVFGLANGGAALGSLVQSLTLHNGKAYIVASGANKVYVVDALTFEYLDTIGGLLLPRFILPLDANTALISQWGAGGLDGSVARVDLNTGQILQLIPTGKGPDKMIRQADDTVVVPNSGGFGVDSTVSILNAAGTAELDRIAVPGKNPGSAAIAKFSGTSTTYVHCQGSYLDATPQGWVGPLSAGGGTLTEAYGNDLVASPGKQALYFAAGGNIYVLEASGLRVLASQAAWGLGCHPETGYLFCGDAKDFNSAGEVVMYQPDGTRVGAFPCGVTPGEIVFIR